MDVSEATRDLLFRLGVSSKYKGFSHATYVVILCIEQEERLLFVTKLLYPDIAKRYKTNWKAVERNIRTVSTVAWKRNRILLEALAQRSLDECLCATEFVNVLFHAVSSDVSQALILL